mgnify:FL=1
MINIVQEMNNCISKALSSPVLEKDKPLCNVLDESKWPRLKYTESNRLVSVELHPQTWIKVDKHLASILGWELNPLVNYEQEVQTFCGTNASDINGRIHNMYIYTDLIENVTVGDTEAPLLRIVETAGKFGDVIHQSFKMLRYIPLRKKSFDTIELDIRDVFGEPVSFESGILVVTLHFRRASIQR